MTKIDGRLRQNLKKRILIGDRGRNEAVEMQTSTNDIGNFSSFLEKFISMKWTAIFSKRSVISRFYNNRTISQELYHTISCILEQHCLFFSVRSIQCLPMAPLFNYYTIKLIPEAQLSKSLDLYTESTLKYIPKQEKARLIWSGNGDIVGRRMKRRHKQDASKSPIVKNSWNQKNPWD